MISLIIPTLNRSEFVIRYLYYLSENGFNGSVFIGDSSDQWHFDQTKRVAEKLRRNFEIIHNYYPGFTINDCIDAMLPLVKTPYAMYINDDDILVLPTVKKCIDFLSKNPEYSAATGIAVHCHLESCGKKQKIYTVRKGKLNKLESNTGAKRLIELLNDYSVVAFSVARTVQLRERHLPGTNFRDIYLSAELLPCSMLAVQGKLKKFDQIFVVRQIHQRRYITSDKYDWIVNPRWQASYQIFHDHLVKCLMREDSIDVEKAHESVKQAFWAYLSKTLSYKFKSRYHQSPIIYLKGRLKRITFLYNIWRKIKNSNKNCLASLTNPNSPYYKDFMSAYQIITRDLDD